MGDGREGELAGAEVVAGQGHPPVGQVLHRGLAQGVAEVADAVAAVTGRPVTHQDLDPETWIGGAVAAGLVPADYAVMLRWLTRTIASGNGSTPNADIEKVTGRPPTAFEDFARRDADAWATAPAVK